MARILLHRKALRLRKQGKSYSQIKAILGISKSTLSDWLRAFPLTREQVNSLRGRSEIRIEKFRQTMRKKRDERLNGYYIDQKNKILPLTKRELLVAGLFLYWGEGNKSQRSVLSINNTDPTMLKFALLWMTEGLRVPREKIVVFLHLYSDMDANKELLFWSTYLHMPVKQFAKPYIKENFRSSIDQKGFGHGTCGLRVSSTVLKERLLMAIKAIADFYEAKT